jgi:hypothetical protein
MKDDLDVGPGSEPVAGSDQPRAKFRAVVDFSVADQHDIAGFVPDRLLAALEVDDAEPAESQRRAPGRKVALVVRPTMHEGGSHAPCEAVSVVTNSACNAAHVMVSFLESGAA